MIGACVYCGQMGAVEAINQEAAIKITTKTVCKQCVQFTEIFGPEPN